LEAAVRRLFVSVLFILAALYALTPRAEAHKATGKPAGPKAVALALPESWPIESGVKAAIVHPARTEIDVTASSYLSPVPFSGAAVAAASAPTRDVIAWEDGETLLKREDWTQFTLGCNARGERLWLEIPSGKVQFEWAEVVFQTGQSQVVQFTDKVQTPGLFTLLDVTSGKIVDHVRVLARAKSDEAKVILRLQKG
jgi:hypothetical protein